MWIHIEIDFKTNNNLSTTNHSKLLNLIRYIVMDLKPKRKFWLFEPKPDFFLACEIDNIANIDKSKIVFYKSIAPHFIKKIWLKTNCKDERNGKIFLDVMNLYADAILENKKARWPHIFHCILNQMGFNKRQEAQYYYWSISELLAHKST